MSSTADQLQEVLDQAMAIYNQRDGSYGNQWKKYGWRGALFNARRKVERAWAIWWDAVVDTAEISVWQEKKPVRRVAVGELDVDDLLDTIMYCAMAVLEIRGGNRDGEGGWWE